MQAVAAVMINRIRTRITLFFFLSTPFYLLFYMNFFIHSAIRAEFPKIERIQAVPHLKAAHDAGWVRGLPLPFHGQAVKRIANVLLTG